ncbi:PIN domain-containing protein [Sphingomonas koreensis]|nr:PIN domain-containing protein [Sphingomonas koreensis]
MIFVDTSVLIDLIEPEGEWRDWSEEALASLPPSGEIITNHVVVAEIARQFATFDDERNFLTSLGIVIAAMPDEAAYRAGKAHAAYRAAGGARAGVLADFLMGGHASTLDATLLTRDRQRFATYFPELALITPETDNG